MRASKSAFVCVGKGGETGVGCGDLKKGRGSSGGPKKSRWLHSW
jgi:hypothetical protein